MDEYKLVDKVNNNSMTSKIEFLLKFYQNIIQLIDSLIDQRIKVEIFFDSLKILILQYNKRFKIKDSF